MAGMDVHSRPPCAEDFLLSSRLCDHGVDDFFDNSGAVKVLLQEARHPEAAYTDDDLDPLPRRENTVRSSHTLRLRTRGQHPSCLHHATSPERASHAVSRSQSSRENENTLFMQENGQGVRLVVFEYLLPMQRRNRHLRSCLQKENLTCESSACSQVSFLMEDLLRLSDRLLEGHGFPTSYIYPVTYGPTIPPHLRDRYLVYVLVDCDGPFCWDPDCPRKADPMYGFRAGDVHADRMFETNTFPDLRVRSR